MARIIQIFSRYFFPLAVVCTYLFLYIPIIILVISSFNANEFTYSWSSFTTRWYYELLSSHEVWRALQNSLIVAISSVMLSLTLGILLIFYSTQRFQRTLPAIFSTNLAIPEIVLAIGLLSFFSYFSIPIGLTTLIAGHTVIGLGYVIPLVYDRFAEIEGRYTEASLDLGATHMQTLLRVILPMLLPAIIAAGLLVFIISLDDFVLAFFCAGATTQTLPIYIFSMIRSGASPLVSALSTVLLVVSSLLVLIFSSLSLKRMDILK